MSRSSPVRGTSIFILTRQAPVERRSEDEGWVVQHVTSGAHAQLRQLDELAAFVNACLGSPAFQASAQASEAGEQQE